LTCAAAMAWRIKYKSALLSSTTKIWGCFREVESDREREVEG
jgi:hypothetical protein